MRPVIALVLLLGGLGAPALSTEETERAAGVDSLSPRAQELYQLLFNQERRALEADDLRRIEAQVQRAAGLVVGEYLDDAAEKALLELVYEAQSGGKPDYFNRFIEELDRKQVGGQSVLHRMFERWDRTAYDEYSTVTQLYYRLFAADEVPQNKVPFHRLFATVFTELELDTPNAMRLLRACNMRYSGAPDVVGDRIQTDFYFLVSRQGLDRLSYGTLQAAREVVAPRVGKGDHNARIDRLRQMLGIE